MGGHWTSGMCERQEGEAVYCHLPADPRPEIKEHLGVGKGGRQETKFW